MPILRAIVFDLDDTLYPEVEFARSGFRAVAAAFADRLGPPEATFAHLIDLFAEYDRARVLDALLDRLGIGDDAALLADMVARFRGHIPTIQMHSDAQRAIERFAGRMPIGLLTDGLVPTQQNKIAALGLAGRVQAVVITGEFAREQWKPHSRGFEEIARRLQCPSGPLAYVGDNLAKDFVAPNALGWMTIRIVRPDGIYQDRTAPAGGTPHHTIHTLDELA